MSVHDLMNKADQRIKAKEVFTVIDANGEERFDVKVISPQMQEKAQKKKELQTYKNKSDNPFTLVNMEASRDVKELDELNTKELGYFLILQSYVGYDNMLKRSADAKLPMTAKELGEALKIKKRTYDKVIEKFIKIGLMYQESVTLFRKGGYQAFYIDKKYCTRGSSRSDKVVKIFIGSLQELYSHNDIKPADIGFLFMLLPFMHFQTNHLVRHPYERDFAKAEALSRKDIVAITGLDEKNVKIHLRMKLSGVNVFGTFRAGRNSIYKINPSLFFRGLAPDEKLKADFTLTGQSL
ncbi:hypothetical protein EV207_10637 [Scopulibacillus darangshiensis]|uniref:Uncharacterized protein n=1 Tax=Scopulibacillus darangshiensis TaxID=442528 RepID=A0A4R2P7N9_9BACL|nr:hypothetical protein [Scopulibacillus darangshiensis]TCP30214.1 hypothetical protein EV207_10637 [Scopulibacillus darangshiensis]